MGCFANTIFSYPLLNFVASLGTQSVHWQWKAPRRWDETSQNISQDMTRTSTTTEFRITWKTIWTQTLRPKLLYEQASTPEGGLQGSSFSICLQALCEQCEIWMGAQKYGILNPKSSHLFQANGKWIIRQWYKDPTLLTWALIWSSHRNWSHTVIQNSSTICQTCTCFDKLASSWVVLFSRRPIPASLSLLRWYLKASSVQCLSTLLHCFHKFIRSILTPAGNSGKAKLRKEELRRIHTDGNGATEILNEVTQNGFGHLCHLLGASSDTAILWL